MISFTNGEKLITFIREHKKPIIIIASILIACFAFSGCKKNTHVVAEKAIKTIIKSQRVTHLINTEYALPADRHDKSK